MSTDNSFTSSKLWDCVVLNSKSGYNKCNEQKGDEENDRGK